MEECSNFNQRHGIFKSFKPKKIAKEIEEVIGRLDRKVKKRLGKGKKGKRPVLK
jgi:hypothetical protein